MRSGDAPPTSTVTATGVRDRPAAALRVSMAVDDHRATRDGQGGDRPPAPPWRTTRRHQRPAAAGRLTRTPVVRVSTHPATPGFTWSEETGKIPAICSLETTTATHQPTFDASMA